MVGLFLAFPFGCWGIYGGVEERSSLPLGLPFPLPGPLPCPFLPLPLPLSAGLPLPLPLPLAMSGSIRIVVSNIHVIHREGWVRGWVNSDPWRTKRSSARGTYRCNTSLWYPRGMTIRYEC